MLKKNVLLVFTDGSINKKTGMCSSAYVAVAKKVPFMTGLTSCKGTNQVGEVTAMYNAVKAIDNLLEVMIKEGNIIEYDAIWFISDSRYTIASINEYSIKWIEQGWDKEWISSSKKPVCHQDKFKEILKLRDKYKDLFKFMHIYSHLTENELDIKHDAFNIYNETDINMITFKEFTKYNDIVDKLAYNEINSPNQ